MSSKKEIYTIEFTEDCRNEIIDIYEYISKNLVAKGAAKKLMRKMRDSVNQLAEFPNLYVKIGKTDKLKRDYHRMVINNYVVLYTVDDIQNKVYIAHMYHGKRNWLNLL